MQVFFIVLTEDRFLIPILQKMNEENFKGTVMHSESIHHALLMDEDVPEFGGLSKVVPNDGPNKPTIFVVLNDEQVEPLRKIVNDVTGGIKGKGFMFSLPASFVEGLGR